MEKLINEIMREAEKDGEPVTREEAEEMARMELGAKQIKRYEHAEKPKSKENKPKKRKTVKVSTEKIQLFAEILQNLTENHENVTVIKQNKLIQIQINDKIFKVDLIQQRNK